MTSTEFSVGATDRANKVLSFDGSGEIAVTQELGTFKGNWSSGTAYVVRDLVKDTSTNNIFLVNTAHTASGSEPLTTNANSAKYDLIVDAATATTQASNAATSATAAASSATAAASSASSASTQASNAASSATASASSATAAAASATSAANSADAFDDVYLGSKSSDPSTDNDGDALAAGMLYFNTTDDVLRVYSGSAWQNAAVDTTNFITLTGTQTLSNKTLTAPVVNGATIGSTDLATASNGDINIAPNGTGKVVIKGNSNQGKIVLNCEANSHGQTIIAAPHSETATNTLTLPSTGGDARLVSTSSTATLTNKTLTSPKIGTSILDTNGNELFKVTATSSAVNELTYSNAATGNNPTFTASGGDTNIGVSILPKGSGKVTIDNLTFPAADGSANQFLQTDGSGNLSFASQTAGGTSWQSSVKTANFTAAAGEGYFINTSGGAFEVDLPSSPSVGDEIEFVDFSRSFATNNLTIDQNGNKFQGFTTPKPVYSTDGQSIKIVYSGSTNGWIPTRDDDVTDEVPQPYSADFLVIAGGGGGGYFFGGAGGAGGYRNSFGSEASGGGGSSETSLTFTIGTVYTVTVGGGGAGTPGTPTADNNGTSGTNTSVSGSGITTITSIGGGGGGGSAGDGFPGADGGSGGGAGGNSAPTAPGGSGTANQGFDGQVGGAGAGGTGGGAGATGASGGTGLDSSITGSSVNRAEGGNAPTTANTGNGGNHDGGNGQSGVVILRVPTANYTGTVSGSPTVTTSGSDTIMTFTGSGTYTG
tara:strand:- start:2050 stop:4350 length:2301 start_codon:yes stop_codon:yes gene_type:complete